MKLGRIFGRKLTVVVALALLTACNGGGSDDETNSVLQQVLDSPREYLNRPIILEGRVREVVGLNAFLLAPSRTGEQSDGDAAQDTTGANDAREGLLVVRSDDLPGLREVIPVEPVQVFEGDVVQVAGPLVLVDPERFDEILDDEVARALILARFAAEPALVALVIDRVEQDTAEQEDGRGD